MGVLDGRKLTNELFLDRVSTELKRAERYRIFVSLIVLDVGFLEAAFPEAGSAVVGNLVNFVERHIRAIDNISLLGSHKLGLLFPETTRQGAEMASRRVAELIKAKLSEMGNRRFDQVIPLEMASYPDAAGAKSIADFLREYSETSLN
jgi:GGDEF domain-containing protein